MSLKNSTLKIKKIVNGFNFEAVKRLVLKIFIYV